MVARLIAALVLGALYASGFRLPNKSAPVYINKTTGEYLPDVDGVYDNPNYLEDYIIWNAAQAEAAAKAAADAQAQGNKGAGEGGNGGQAQDAAGEGSGTGDVADSDATDGVDAEGAEGGAGAGASGGAGDAAAADGDGAGTDNGTSTVDEGAVANDGEGAGGAAGADAAGAAGADAAGVVVAGEEASVSSDAGAAGGADGNAETAGGAGAAAAAAAELNRVVPDYIQDANNYLEYYNHYAEPNYNEDAANTTANATPPAALWRKEVVPQRELVEEVKETKEVNELKEVKKVNEARDVHHTLKHFLGVKEAAANLLRHHREKEALLMRHRDTEDIESTQELQRKMETKAVPKTNIERMLFMRNAPEWYNNLMVNTLKEDGDRQEGHLNMEAPLTQAELAAGGLGVAPRPSDGEESPSVLVGELTPEELAERALAEAHLEGV